MAPQDVPPHRDQAHAIDLKDFAVQHAGLPIGEPLTIIEDHLRRAPVVASRDIDDFYRRAYRHARSAGA